MGVDKAALNWEGQPLWRHQLATLQALHPAEFIVSGKAGLFEHVAVVPDEEPGQGPLGGLLASLRHVQTPWLVALAADLPLISGDFLAGLLRQAAESGKGVIPHTARGFEPLAAVYPRAALPLAREALASGRRSLRPFVETLVERGLAAAFPIAAADEWIFTNPNTPEDWSALTAGPLASRSARRVSSGQ